MPAQQRTAGAIVATLLAVLLWASPVSSGLPPFIEGDVNCDGVTNSIDAAFVLQTVAGLIDAVPCPHVADLNFDGAINSLDAVLVLQITAGICCDKPLTAELAIDSLPLGVPYGEPLPMTLSITNASDQPVERTYNSGQRYDFVVLDSTGMEVWRWSHDMAFIEIILQVTFDPDEKVTYREVWNQQTNDGEQVEPGIYGLTAIDVGCGKPPIPRCYLRGTLKFEIMPPPQ